MDYIAYVDLEGKVFGRDSDLNLDPNYPCSDLAARAMKLEEDTKSPDLGAFNLVCEKEKKVMVFKSIEHIKQYCTLLQKRLIVYRGEGHWETEVLP